MNDDQAATTIDVPRRTLPETAGAAKDILGVERIDVVADTPAQRQTRTYHGVSMPL